jgi:hypothetical protein
MIDADADDAEGDVVQCGRVGQVRKTYPSLHQDPDRRPPRRSAAQPGDLATHPAVNQPSRPNQSHRRSRDRGSGLSCDADEQVRRIDTPDKIARLKGSDPEGYRRHRQLTKLFQPAA